MTTEQTGDEWEKEFDEVFTNEYFYESEWNHWDYKEKSKCFFRDILKKERKAFGGCTKCYGKGYATQITNEIGFPDFYGDIGSKKELDRMIFCDCDRGKQLEKIFNKK